MSFLEDFETWDLLLHKMWDMLHLCISQNFKYHQQSNLFYLKVVICFIKVFAWYWSIRVFLLKNVVSCLLFVCRKKNLKRVRWRRTRIEWWENTGHSWMLKGNKSFPVGETAQAPSRITRKVDKKSSIFCRFSDSNLSRLGALLSRYLKTWYFVLFLKKYLHLYC